MYFILTVKHGRSYRPATRDEVLEAASAYIVDTHRGAPLTTPGACAEVLRPLSGYEREHFAVLFLDTRHRLITSEVLFSGTIDGASVYVREVAKRALEHNAAAIVVGHNHPSGDPAPSEADKAITRKLRDALRVIDVRVLDHIIVAGTKHISFAKGVGCRVSGC